MITERDLVEVRIERLQRRQLFAALTDSEMAWWLGKEIRVWKKQLKELPMPVDKRVFTHNAQPSDNLDAHRLGKACRAAADAPAGDYIDRGLVLLRELQAQGYGIVKL